MAKSIDFLLQLYPYNNREMQNNESLVTRNEKYEHYKEFKDVITVDPFGAFSILMDKGSKGLKRSRYMAKCH